MQRRKWLSRCVFGRLCFHLLLYYINNKHFLKMASVSRTLLTKNCKLYSVFNNIPSLHNTLSFISDTDINPWIHDLSFTHAFTYSNNKILSLDWFITFRYFLYEEITDWHATKYKNNNRTSNQYQFSSKSKCYALILRKKIKQDSQDE